MKYSDKPDIEKLDRIQNQFDNKENVSMDSVEYIIHYSDGISSKKGTIIKYIEDKEFSNLEHFINFRNKVKNNRNTMEKLFPRLIRSQISVEGFIVAAIKELKKHCQES